MSLTLAEANRIAQGAITRAEELDIMINVAVCDSGGRLVAFNRMDGLYGPGPTAARAKRWRRPPSEETAGYLPRGQIARSCRELPRPREGI